MKLLFIFVCIFILLGVDGQESGFTIKGEIFDAVNEEPLGNVNIRVKGTKFGTTTDDLGRFEIPLNRLPVVLEITHIGYQTKSINIQFEPLRSVIINLQPIIENLSGVTITSQKIDTVFVDKKYSVLDYELLDEGILLLIYKYRLSRAELLLLNYEGHKTAELNILPEKPLALYKDCLGEVHIINKTRAYQCYCRENIISLYPSVDIDYFNRTMGDCLFKIRDKMYFRAHEYFNLRLKYSYINILTKEHFNLTQIEDTDKIYFLYDNPENYGYAAGIDRNSLGDLKGLPGDASVIASMRAYVDELRFNQIAYYPEIYAPLFKMGDTICLFNHPESLIEFFNYEDSILFTTPITYHQSEKKGIIETVGYAFVKSSKWQKEIFVDEAYQSAYTLFLNINGTKEVKEIDLNTGDLKSSILIPYPYVQKIKIRNKTIYYIYKGWGETQKKKLFRQHLN